MVTKEEVQIIEDSLWGFNVEWCALDEEGFIGDFLSSGEGPVPLVCLPWLNAYEEFLNSIEMITESWLVEGEGRTDFWLNVAKCGLYSYDYRTDRKLYTVCAAPIIPIHISDINKVYHPLLHRVVLPGVRFREMPPMDFPKLGLRTSWEHRRIPPSRQNVER